MFSSLQSDQSAELEAQTSKLDKGSILLSSLAQGQEEQRFVALGEVSLCLGTCGTPACSVTTKKVLEEGPKRGSRSISRLSCSFTWPGCLSGAGTCC